MPTFRIRLVCHPAVDPVSGDPLPGVEEVVTVHAGSTWEAREKGILVMTIRALGREVEAYEGEAAYPILRPVLNGFRSGVFSVDGLDSRYAGYTRGDDWNGWATPLFPEGEARRIAADYASQKSIDGEYDATIDSQRGVFMFYNPSGDYWDEFEPVVEGTTKLYPVGAYSWTWSEVAPTET